MAKMTRRELYDLVWSQPMLTLAKRFGISDVALGKVCRKHNIPRPYPGYWAQKQANKPVKVPPLPDGDAGREVRIHERSQSDQEEADRARSAEQSISES